ncbi:hypothetical protein J8281_06120 [Aquimarina sp. U1-2]|uniref:hypothetical protein n=1 Tax=Aquimarina sp. U1-2 TaxID=2823141 RepID=UPI001AEC8F8D|nr:hypothetical protein [Aquimarina sp. U1-2]MBP2831760.1 hypothetical protein [Aquimarina sp. U1-2]
MKKLFIVLFALVLGAGQAYALEGNPLESDQLIRDEVAKLLKNPQIDVEKSDLTASIQFTLNKKGELVVLDVDSEKDLVIDYIKSRLNYKKVVVEKVKNTNRIYTLSVTITKPQNA